MEIISGIILYLSTLLFSSSLNNNETSEVSAITNKVRVDAINKDNFILIKVFNYGDSKILFDTSHIEIFRPDENDALGFIDVTNNPEKIQLYEYTDYNDSLRVEDKGCLIKPNSRAEFRRNNFNAKRFYLELRIFIMEDELNVYNKDLKDSVLNYKSFFDLELANFVFPK